MSEQEKYDELIRQKFAEKEFIFNEENWEKAEIMLDKYKKTKKIFWLSSIFLIGLITGITCMLLFTKGDSGKTIKNDLTDTKHPVISSQGNAISGNNSSPAKEGYGPASNLPETASSNNNNGGTSFENKLENRKQKNQETTIESDQLETGKINREQDFKSSTQADLENKSIKQNNAAYSKKANAGTNTKKTVTKENLLQTGKATMKLPNSKNKSVTIKNTKKETTPDNSQKSDDSTEENPTTSSVFALKETAKKSVSIKKNLKVADSTQLTTDAENKMDLTTISKKETREMNDSTNALNDSTQLKEMQLATTDSLKSKTDSAGNQKAMLDPLPMDGLASVTILSIDGGINAQLGWKYSDVTEGRGITPILGLGVTHCFNQKWSLYFGVHYGSIAYLKASTIKEVSTTYSFGSKTTETIGKPGILHYAVVPLTIQYHFDEHNAIFAGGSIGLLLNRKNKIELNSTSVSPQSNALDLTTVTTTEYYSESFNKLDAAISAGYRRKLSSHFTLITVINYGMLDIKKNAFFSQDKFERNTGLKFIVSYTIFDF
jgi:hypothetical protein